MVDIILDTNYLAELITQYYQTNHLENDYFRESSLFQDSLIRELNNIVRNYNNGFLTGLIIASSYAFVEIARKFDGIVKDRFTIEKFAAFIEQPPSWFFISSVDYSLFQPLLDIPGYVVLNGEIKPIEWADALHIATALSRDKPWLLAISDRRMKEIKIIKDFLI